MAKLAVLLPAFLAFLAGAVPALAWTWPVEGPVLRPFVLGDDPYAGGQHRGVDVGAAAGESVLAPASGLVSFAGAVPGGGLTVTIRTGDGYAVTLQHLGAIALERGSSLEEGQPLGRAGASGDPEYGGPYVHLGVRLASDEHGYVDPLLVLPARDGAPAETAPPPAEEPAGRPSAENQGAAADPPPDEAGTPAADVTASELSPPLAPSEEPPAVSVQPGDLGTLQPAVVGAVPEAAQATAPPVTASPVAHADAALPPVSATPHPAGHGAGHAGADASQPAANASQPAASWDAPTPAPGSPASAAAVESDPERPRTDHAESDRPAAAAPAAPAATSSTARREGRHDRSRVARSGTPPVRETGVPAVASERAHARSLAPVAPEASSPLDPTPVPFASESAKGGIPLSLVGAVAAAVLLLGAVLVARRPSGEAEAAETAPETPTVPHATATAREEPPRPVARIAPPGRRRQVVHLAGRERGMPRLQARRRGRMAPRGEPAARERGRRLASL